MTKNKPTIKKAFNISERITMINFLVNNYFITDENGETYYTPYFKDTNFMEAFFKYMVDGLEFNENDNIYELVVADRELNKIFEDWMVNVFTKKSTALAKQVADIMLVVDDMVKFRKEMLIASQSTSGMSPMIEMKLIELIEKEHSRNDTEVKALNELQRFYENQNKLIELMGPNEYVEIMKRMSEQNLNSNETASLLAKEMKRLLDTNQTPKEE